MWPVFMVNFVHLIVEEKWRRRDYLCKNAARDAQPNCPQMRIYLQVVTSILKTFLR